MKKTTVVLLSLLCAVYTKRIPIDEIPIKYTFRTITPTPRYPTYGTRATSTSGPPQGCTNPIYPDLVLDKAEAYEYLHGKYRYQRYPFRSLLHEMKRGWLDEKKFPKITFTDKQERWIHSLEEKVIARVKRQVGPLCQRKEYRMLSTTERDTLHDAFNAMHSNFPDPSSSDSEYHIFVKMHRNSNAPAAHGGPAFLPWHREYLKLFEQALQNHEPTACLAYWDSTLDQPLPDPSDSVIWSDPYLGNNNGFVNSGLAENWPVLDTCEQAGGSTLYRNAMTGSSGNFALFSDLDIDWVMNQDSFDGITCPNNCKFESDHGAVHVFVGGQMSTLSCSPSDPVFWMHHAFVDCTWQRFRELDPYPGPNPPHLDYGSTAGAGSGHGSSDPMLPFDNIINAQGLSNHYTDYYYSCAPSPSTCDPDNGSMACGSDLLWCDPETCMCKSKVHVGGDCTGLPHQACAGPCTNKFSWIKSAMQPYCNRYSNTCGCRYFTTFIEAERQSS